MKQATEKGGAYQVTLSGDTTVNFHHARLWDITPDTSGRTVSLPDARLYRPGGVWAIVNRGTDSVAVDDNAGGSLLTALAQDKGVLVGLVSNTTQAGVWALFERDVGVVSNPALSVLGYVFSGYTSATTAAENDAREWNPQLATWTAKTDSTYRHKRGAGYTIGAKGYVVTGDVTLGTNEHEQYDPDTWTTVTSYPVSTYDGNGCALNDGTADLGFVFDGRTTSDSARAYTPSPTDSWASVTDQTDGTLYASSASINSLGYIVGGDPHSTGGFTSGFVTEYDPVGDSYASETAIIHGRMFFSLTGLSGYGYVFGGATNTSTSQTTCWDEANTYDTAAESWSLGTDYPLGRVCESAVMVLDSKHHICGGDNFTTSTSGGVLEDGVQQYDSSLDTYSAQQDMPEAREEIHGQGQSIQA